MPLEAQTVKKLPAVQETRVQSLGQEDPLKEMGIFSIPTPVFLPGEPHGQSSLAGCIQSMGSQESDTT